jgi:hypothetical protein
VTRIGDSGASKGIPFVYAPDVEPYISNSGDLTRDKIAKLVEMVISSTNETLPSRRSMRSGKPSRMARKRITYQRSAQFREQFNGCPIHEPSTR